jgi:type II secretory ATPase GspE/PulE/Tfp pilus assembly ATPase PilB-like protein
VAAGVITEEQLEAALAAQRTRRRRLGRVLVELGMATEDQIVAALAAQLNVLRVHLADLAPDPQVLAIAPEAQALKDYRGPTAFEGATDVAILEAASREGPIVELVNAMVIEAVRARAADIHIEPDRQDVRIRYRVDGLLRTVRTLPRSVLAATVSRVKIMADMDITEKRVPQDGRIVLMVKGQEMNIRVSTMPTQYGEGAVLRILPRSGQAPGLAGT